MWNRYQQAIQNYQSHPEECNKSCHAKIVDYLLQQPYVTKTLYRGQGSSTEIKKTDFFSCSSEYEIVIEEGFTRDVCCMFVIHIVDVPVIDVNKTLGEYSLFPEQQEFIVLGGGTFYKDSAMTNKGFFESKVNRMRVFTAYYNILDVSF